MEPVLPTQAFTGPCRELLWPKQNSATENMVQTTLLTTQAHKKNNSNPRVYLVQAMEQGQSDLSEEEQGLSSTTFNTGQMTAARVLTAIEVGFAAEQRGQISSEKA